jgi:N-ethylmaleimide reductase
MPSIESSLIFKPLRIGDLDLPNRVVMASMTRGRATNAGLVPTWQHVEYYRRRAAAGLLISEAVWISPAAIGFVNVPGLYTDQQVTGWRAVTDAVHDAGGRIFAQLAHSGAVSHPDFFEGALPLAPSAVNPGLRSFTPSGFKETLTPQAMTIDQIRATVADYRNAARNAKRSGFDGVELHCATSYLLPEFLSSALNLRTDAYGGSIENRSRIVFEILEAMIAEWGAGRVGIKIAPTFAMGGFAPTLETQSTFDYLVDGLNRLPISHLQVVRALKPLGDSPVAGLQETIGYYRRRFGGILMANGGLDFDSGEALIRSASADLVSFATLFIGNPDLVERWRTRLPLAGSDPQTYYQGGALGYIE